MGESHDLTRTCLPQLVLHTVVVYKILFKMCENSFYQNMKTSVGEDVDKREIIGGNVN